MKTEKDAFLDVFGKLDQENRADVLAHVRVAYAAQEHTKRHYGISPESRPEQTAGDRTAA
jgi:hypothetical protein